MLDNYGYKHTIKVCNTYCFFHSHDGYGNAAQCCLIRKVPVLLSLCLRISLHVLAKNKRLSLVKINYVLFLFDDK